MTGLAATILSVESVARRLWRRGDRRRGSRLLQAAAVLRTIETKNPTGQGGTFGAGAQLTATPSVYHPRRELATCNYPTFEHKPR